MEKNKKSSLLLSTLVLDDSRVTEIVKKKRGKNGIKSCNIKSRGKCHGRTEAMNQEHAKEIIKILHHDHNPTKSFPRNKWKRFMHFQQMCKIYLSNIEPNQTNKETRSCREGRNHKGFFVFFFFQGLINLLLEKALYIISKWAKSPREGDLGGGGKLVTYLTDYILLLSYTPFLFSLLLTNHEHER